MTSSADCSSKAPCERDRRPARRTGNKQQLRGAAAPARLRRGYWVPAKLAFLMTLAQRTVSDFT
jgi:hypothetical protein